jgi:hypothetical protein
MTELLVLAIPIATTGRLLTLPLPDGKFDWPVFAIGQVQCRDQYDDDIQLMLWITINLFRAIYFLPYKQLSYTICNQEKNNVRF